MSTMYVRFINYFTSDSKLVSGDAIIIECDGKFGMIDAGGSESKTLVAQAVAAGKSSVQPEEIADVGDLISYMRDGLKITDLEFFIQTHFHSDHAWHSSEVIDQFNVKAVYATLPETVGYGFSLAEKNTAPDNFYGTDIFEQKFKDACGRKGITIIAPKEGEQVILGSATLNIINTDGIKHSKAPSDYNVASLAVFLQHGNVKVLFCGDSTYDTMNAHAQAIGQVDLVATAHHGWGKNTSATMAFALKPKIAVTSHLKANTDYKLWSSGLYQIASSAELYHLESGAFYPLAFESDGNTIVSLNDKSVTKFTWTNTWIDATNGMSRWYYVDGYGNRVSGWKEIGGAWYYFCPVSSTITNSNKSFYYGQMYFAEWVKGANGIDWYYLKDSGVMAANESINIGGKVYNFASSGICTNP